MGHRSDNHIIDDIFCHLFFHQIQGQLITKNDLGAHDFQRQPNALIVEDSDLCCMRVKYCVVYVLLTTMFEFNTELALLAMSAN